MSVLFIAPISGVVVVYVIGEIVAPIISFRRALKFLLAICYVFIVRF